MHGQKINRKTYDERGKLEFDQDYPYTEQEEKLTKRVRKKGIKSRVIFGCFDRKMLSAATNKTIKNLYYLKRYMD